MISPNQEREKYLLNIKSIFDLNELFKKLENLKNINVLCIGDTVIDRYTFVDPKGRALKDSILSTIFQGEENYAGGILALVNHMGAFVNNIKLVTLVGDKWDSFEENNSIFDFLKKEVASNVELKCFVKKNSPTTIKKRYIDAYKKNKLFKVEYINDEPISSELSSEISSYLSDELPDYDLIVVLDYDHGFINEEIRKVIQEKSRFLSINSQVNSSNLGFNYITKYNRSDFIAMNEVELRLPMRMKFENIEEVIDKFSKEYHHNTFLVTLGRKGCLFFNKNVKYKAPILTDKVVDAVGAGDAIFALTSLLAYSNFSGEEISFIVNCVGGIEVNILGNKEYITKEKLFSFMTDAYNGSKEKERIGNEEYINKEKLLAIIKRI